VGGRLFSIACLCRTKQCNAVVYLLKCGKNCVIADMDSIMPYLVDTVKTTMHYKIKYISLPAILTSPVSYVKLKKYINQF
jgi:hypothetical protein